MKEQKSFALTVAMEAMDIDSTKDSPLLAWYFYRPPVVPESGSVTQIHRNISRSNL